MKFNLLCIVFLAISLHCQSVKEVTNEQVEDIESGTTAEGEREEAIITSPQEGIVDIDEKESAAADDEDIDSNDARNLGHQKKHHELESPNFFPFPALPPLLPPFLPNRPQLPIEVIIRRRRVRPPPPSPRPSDPPFDLPEITIPQPTFPPRTGGDVTLPPFPPPPPTSYPSPLPPVSKGTKLWLLKALLSKGKTQLPPPPTLPPFPVPPPVISGAFVPPPPPVFPILPPYVPPTPPPPQTTQPTLPGWFFTTTTPPPSRSPPPPVFPILPPCVPPTPSPPQTTQPTLPGWFFTTTTPPSRSPPPPVSKESLLRAYSGSPSTLSTAPNGWMVAGNSGGEYYL